MPVFFLGNHAAERGPCSSHEQHLVTGRSPLLFAAYITSALEKKKRRRLSQVQRQENLQKHLRKLAFLQVFPPSSSAINWSKKASNKRGHSSPWTCYHNDQMSSRCHGGTGGGGGGGGGGKCDCKMPPTPKSILISPLKLDILKITEDYSKVRCAFILNKKETHGGREKNFNAITLF